jgi:alpha-beta hydrolase superfamily lysophospholipase
MPKRRKLTKRFLRLLAISFVLVNVIACFHAYKFTHFTKNLVEKTKSPEKLSPVGKLKTLLFGVNNPRPANKALPKQYYQTISLQSNKKIECWHFTSENSAKTGYVKGTVILFHGYSGEKSSMLDKSFEFQNLGYNTLVVDFMGSGGSEGNQTTLGYKEAEQVKTSFDYITKLGETNIYLFGTSMGAVAILKAINDYNLNVNGIIVECPFGSMYKTTCARFKIMNTPCFPMAGLLVFWGGMINGFWAYGHNPTEYAKNVNSPTLLLYGEKDRNVSRQEIDEIYTNLKGPKILRTYKLAEHENYLKKYKNDWVQDVKEFLTRK